MYVTEQPQGAPSVAAMTTEESCFEGGGICAARGKNLKGKNETEVIFSSNDGAWKEKAIVHHNVTTVKFIDIDTA